ncbi:MAG TPA: M28 family peptidase [Gemmatimonadaceae bacterium]|nr:M28 family peptidase [Gemmatimonadaceae bacterium]
MRHRTALGLVLLAACARTTPPAATPAPVSTPQITADELRRDLAVFASDSFAGRETGTPGAWRAAQFLATRLMALGVEPAGDSLYYQRVPLVREGIASTTQLSITQGGSSVPLPLGTGIIPWTNLGAGAPVPRRAAEGDLVFAGYGMNTLGRNDFRGITDAGKVIVMVHEAPPEITDSTTRKNLESQDELAQRLLRALQLRPAAIILLMNGGTREFFSMLAPELMRAVSSAPGDQTTSDAQRPLPMVLVGLATPGSPLLPAGWPNDNTPQALTGRRFAGRVDVRREPFIAYNVVGVVRGSDARLNKSYVAFGAHYDHIGIQTGMTPDSIANGADDDGSGSVTMLAVARAMQAVKPRRSGLFVWHVGEEKGLLGSAYYTDHPTVPIDSIVAQLNADMIGRDAGPTSTFDTRVSGAAMTNKLYVVGPNAAPNNQSKVLGAILDTVNARQSRPMQLDHEWDSTTHPEKIYERSDHYNYAKKGIPIVFFTTGLHEDYHKVSDDPSKIDYEKMARIGNLLVQMGETVANREARPK